MAVVRTQRGLDRLVNFSDATVAIAITLLILPLADETPVLAHESIGRFFAGHEWQLLAFAISFVVIARHWIAHHHVFECVVGYDTPLVWLNFLWLASIVFIPFTTNVLADSKGDHGIASVYALYIGNLLLTTVVLSIIELVLLHTPGLMLDDARGGLDPMVGWSLAILMAVAGLLAVLVPVVGMFWLFLLALATPLSTLLKRVARRGRR